MNEFHIYYSQTEWYLLFRGVKESLLLQNLRLSKQNYINNNTIVSLVEYEKEES